MLIIENKMKREQNMYKERDLKAMQDETPRYNYFSGWVERITNLRSGNTGEIDGCTKLYTLQDDQGSIVTFTVDVRTYFVDGYKVGVGSQITCYYSTNAPVILIYPPQYRAVVVSQNLNDRQIKVDRFDQNLTSADGTLSLSISSETNIELENGQSFEGNLAGRDLIVIYSSSTRSIPALTVPIEIIVMCP